MPTNPLTPVEHAFFSQSGLTPPTTKIPYITVENFPKLGLLTALRFLEWAAANPEGVISLPTGKSPEYFIKWTQYLLKHWDSPKAAEIRADYQLELAHKPVLSGLQFVQIDEFYPISGAQHNSFYDFVTRFYIEGFGLDPARALTMNADTIPLVDGKHFSEVFPNHNVDLSLRYRDCRTMLEKQQQQSIFMLDDWCSAFEQQIRDRGGIGFFLGGIGPDGHIAFNTRGSDHFSTTRLTATNFETQAVAAGDLGGIEIAKNRLVITIGLATVTHNPEAVALIIAAGEAKAEVVRQALENEASNLYPATVLHKLPNSRFYLTHGAAARLTDTQHRYYTAGEWTQEKTDRAVIDLCRRLNKYSEKITVSDLKNDLFCAMIPEVNAQTVPSVIASIQAKLKRGLAHEQHQTYFHTGPHHDDIMLGLLPHINRQLRSATNTFHFGIMTSGFTAVTNKFIKMALSYTEEFLNMGRIPMCAFPDFFESGYQHKWDKDVSHYLDSVARRDPMECMRGLCHRLVRAIVTIYPVPNREALMDQIAAIRTHLDASYDGQKNPPQLQTLKGMIREFEEELVWAHFGIQVNQVHHLRLGFYTGDIFTQQPDKKRDVMPILARLKAFQPSVISLALDPEGSGPDTHYKVLQAIADAIREWAKDTDLAHLRIWGYRNVWYRFHPADANVYVPVSINALSVLNSSFSNSYLSQVDASFPSYQLDGKFSELTQKIWVEQLKDIQLLLGKGYFYENELPIVRATHGLLFFKEMTVAEFLSEAKSLEKSMEGVL